MIIGIVIGVVVLFLLIVAGISVRIVREYQRIVLFRLGRALGTRGPGLIFINPVTDRTAWVDLREQYLEIPHQTAITKDNASISIDFIIFYKVIDPSMSVLRVGNFAEMCIRDREDGVTLVCPDLELVVHLGDERTAGIDHDAPSSRRRLFDLGGRSVSREHERR